jgi:hypothetical protein
LTPWQADKSEPDRTFFLSPCSRQNHHVANKI